MTFTKAFRVGMRSVFSYRWTFWLTLLVPSGMTILFIQMQYRNNRAYDHCTADGFIFAAMVPFFILYTVPIFSVLITMGFRAYHNKTILLQLQSRRNGWGHMLGRITMLSFLSSCTTLLCVTVISVVHSGTAWTDFMNKYSVFYAQTAQLKEIPFLVVVAYVWLQVLITYLFTAVLSGAVYFFTDHGYLSTIVVLFFCCIRVPEQVPLLGFYGWRANANYIHLAEPNLNLLIGAAEILLMGMVCTLCAKYKEISK